MPSILSHAQKLKEFSISLRRDLHMHPELGFQEVRTAGIVADELRNLGYAVTEKVGKTGVVGMMTGDESGPTVMLRFDMDALPIVEETGADYASQTPGIMHACGHDGHVTIGLTVARLLVQQKSNLKGNVKIVFQPAEEGLGGAAAMIEDGVLEYPRPDAALGLHLWNDHPVGWAAVTAGPFMTGADMFRIKITGKGGHGAIPNETIDPLIAGTQVVSALQSVVSRNISPFDFAVVSITRFQAGTSFNIIPSEAELLGTVRTFKSDVRVKVHDRMLAIVESVCTGMGCRGEIEFFDITPPVVNAEYVTGIVRDAIVNVIPEMKIDSAFQGSASEDMALFLQEVQGCFFFIGSGPVDSEKRFGHHHPKFDIDEDVLPQAAAIMTQAAINLLDSLAATR
ncbi:MAG: M20 metallopeptidase family protein [Bellilinea sp.]